MSKWKYFGIASRPPEVEGWCWRSCETKTRRSLRWSCSPSTPLYSLASPPPPGPEQKCTNKTTKTTSCSSSSESTSEWKTRKKYFLEPGKVRCVSFCWWHGRAFQKFQRKILCCEVNIVLFMNYRAQWGAGLTSLPNHHRLREAPARALSLFHISWISQFFHLVWKTFKENKLALKFTL